jgi:hypothetical protein
MNVALWAEIRRLAEIEKLSARVISRRLRCSGRTVAKALELDQAPTRGVSPRDSLLNPYKTTIDALLVKYPELSAVRICEEISRGPDGYTGSVITVRRYLRSIRLPRGRVYQEVHYEPAQAMQVDWGTCGSVPVGQTRRSSRSWWPCSAIAGWRSSNSLCRSARPCSIAGSSMRSPFLEAVLVP